ncbi:Uncharacterised protein [Mycobacteroides abscessus subsp. abscessus]|nr:Uncharacterised protein [Mycobacteroides abscessus subsp. abscessus]
MKSICLPKSLPSLMYSMPSPPTVYTGGPCCRMRGSRYCMQAQGNNLIRLW